MYYCENCKGTFEEPKIIHTTYESYYGVSSDFDSYTPYDYQVCPYCRSDNFDEKGDETMERKIIDLNETDMTFEDINQLEDYIWKNDKLIPEEMFEDE